MEDVYKDIEVYGEFEDIMERRFRIWLLFKYPKIYQVKQRLLLI